MSKVIVAAVFVLVLAAPVGAPVFGSGSVPQVELEVVIYEVEKSDEAKTEKSNAPNAPGGANQRSDTDPGTVTVTVTGEKSEGICLAVTPTIGTKMLTVTAILVEHVELGVVRERVAVIIERHTNTTATPTPGKIFTIGGMEKETKTKESRGIPLLKSPSLSIPPDAKMDVRP